MRLLIFTQAVDTNDPVMGFFHGWLREFSRKFEEITVIALKTGALSLPQNVKVHSLGKEKMSNKAVMIFRLMFLIWRTRDTDAVLVHMNKEYVIAGWLVWKLKGIPVYFWYNHKYADWLARFAMKLSRKVFYTSNHSVGAKLKNAVPMPVGVDTELFKNQKAISDRGRHLLSLGRIDPVKNIDILAWAVEELDNKSRENFNLTIAGSPGWGNEKYAASIREILRPLVDKGKVCFVGNVIHNKTVELFNENKIFINLTESGSFDKTILEAMACGCLIISANKSVSGIIGSEGVVDAVTPDLVARKITSSLAISNEDAERRSAKNREFVLKNHSLGLLSDKLVSEIKSV